MAGVMAKAGGGARSNSVATAMAIAGRASRACDVCGSQRARWYCHADNAYLCHRCDESVHSANSLALRHERVRLNATSQLPKKVLPVVFETSGGSNSNRKSTQYHSAPSCKRSRLSRRSSPHSQLPSPDMLTFHKGSRGKATSEGRRQGGSKSHEVPNFITVNIQESPVSFTHDSATAMSMAEHCKDRAAAAVAMHAVDADAYEELSSGDSDQFLVPNGYLDDFENAVGASISCHDDDVEYEEDEEENPTGDDTAVNVSPEPLCASDNDCYRHDFSHVEGMRDVDAFEGDCGDTTSDAAAAVSAGHEPDEDSVQECHPVVPDSLGVLINQEVASVLRCSQLESKPSPSLLRLNFADVMSAWSDHRSLWTDGKRLQTVPDDSTSEAAGGMDVGLVPDLNNGRLQGEAPKGVSGDADREARVMRYREKRRTRLFSKKIRYEVRKINAERRPRMKGRFVKQTPGCFL